MILAGADLSSRSIALTILGGPSPFCAKYKVKDSIKDRHEIMFSLRTWAEDVLDFSQVGYVFIEEPIVAGARNLRSSLLIAQTCGALLSTAGMERVMYLVAVSSWKKATVGSGSADKEAVRRWLDNTHPQIAALCGSDQDLYDSAAIALHGQGLLGRGHDLSRLLHDEPRLA